jgi:hypothetical protein
MERRIATRDQEIARLGQLYRGGQNFDSVKLTYDR